MSELKILRANITFQQALAATKVLIEMPREFVPGRHFIQTAANEDGVVGWFERHILLFDLAERRGWLMAEIE